MENKKEKSAEKIVILDAEHGKVFIRSVPLEQIEWDANEIVEAMAEKLEIRESNCQYMVVNDEDFLDEA